MDVRIPQKNPDTHSVSSVESKKINFRESVLSKSHYVTNGVSNLVHKVKRPRKHIKYSTKLHQTSGKRHRNNAILGIGQLLVVVSIAYSTAVIFIGVGTIESKVALIPQSVFALYILLKAFSKLHK